PAVGQPPATLSRLFVIHAWPRDHMDPTALDPVPSAWNPATKTASFGLRSSAAPTADNDLLLRWDFGLADRGGPPRFSYARCWNPNALCIKRRNYTGPFALLIGGLNTSYFLGPTQ